MIPEQQVIKLLKKYKLNKTIINHCKGVSKIAFELSNKILENNPKLDINPKKVEIAGLLHDIGKSEDGIHELNTIEILLNEGLDDIAEISMHGFMYEYFKEKNDNDYEKYLPKTIENKILVLSDMYYNQKQERVSIDERFDDILNRYSNDSKFCDTVIKAKSRILLLEKELIELM